jgi:hypothetical protein
MTTATWVILVIIAAVAIVIVLAVVLRAQKTKRLRSKFGPEYDYQVQQRGNTALAERELDRRTKRVGKFRLRALTPEECERFSNAWRDTQTRFVDDPRGAVAEADRLVHEAMEACGYPAGEVFEENAADLSVEHPVEVEHYRAAHALAAKDSRGEGSTEDLRAALKHYRALFEDLLKRPVIEYGEIHR